MRNEFNPFGDNSESSDKNEDDDSKREEKRWVAPPLVPPEHRPGFRAPLLFETFESKTKETDDDEDEDETKPKSAAAHDEGRQPEEPERSEDETGSERNALEPQTTLGTETDASGEEPVSDGSEAVSADEFEESGILHIRRDGEAGKHEFVASDEQGQGENAPSSAPASDGGFIPPRPPIFPPTENAPFDRPGEPEPLRRQFGNQFTPSQAWNNTPASVISIEQHNAELKDTKEAFEKRGLRRGLVAGFITGYVLKAYLANRKQARYEKASKKQINERSEQITHLQREQQKLSEQLTARTEEYRQRQEQMIKNQPTRFEKPTVAARAEVLPQAKTAEVEQIFDQEGNEIVLRPGWHVERSAGGYSVVLDEHNRIVHDAIHYGEAFKRDQKREQLSDNLFASVTGSTSIGNPRDNNLPQQMPPIFNQLPSVQYPAPPVQQQPEVDLKHRLPKPRSQLISTVGNPWLWTAVAILIIIYFIAALA